jgi:hypothetical protein
VKKEERRRITVEVPRELGSTFPTAAGASVTHTGAAGELAASAAFLRMGFEVVLRSVSHASPYDLAVAKSAAAKLKRVEVKVGARRWRRDGTSYLTCMVQTAERRAFDWLTIIDPRSGLMMLVTPAGMPAQTTGT